MDRSGSKPGPEPPTGPEPWSRAGEELLAELDVELERGLDEAEARARLDRFGPNLLRRTETRSAWAILLAQLRSVLVALLAVGAGLSFALGQHVEGASILVVIALNTAIGFVTELKAVRSMEALRELGDVEAAVRRDGQVRRVSAQALVPGDLVLVEGGDVVTADLRLLEASLLQANESMLTGESAAVYKRVDPLPAERVLAERDNMLFKGTAVTRGAGLGLVVATGQATEIGKIASLVAEAEEGETPLEERLELLGRRLMWASLAFVAAIALVGLILGRDWVLIVETAIALAVATVPEGLPIVATVALARGMWRMARRNALIQRLAAVESLGSVNLILSDKTGTLTQNRMRVATVITAEGTRELAQDDAPGEAEGEDEAELDALVDELLALAALCTDAVLHSEDPEGPDGVGDPMELALLRATAARGRSVDALRRERPELREQAFDPELKMMATFHQGPAGVEVAVKGAPEAVLGPCTRERTRAGERELDDDGRARWRARAEALAADGYRVLAVAHKQVDAVEAPAYESLDLLGLLALADPPRASARAVVAACDKAGVRVVMVTGDHAGTAASIARAVAIFDPAEGEADSEVIEGREIPAMAAGDEDQRRALVSASVIARASPQQKLQLMSLHQESGDVVAMIGDGVNDTPALKQADVGVAMGLRGTQAAREAADVVLRDDEFATIAVAIREGRIIFDNLRKFAVYLVSCNLSEILIVGLAALANAPLPILPLQILFLNLVTDVFPALALGVGEGDDTVMDRPPRPPGESFLTRRLWGWIGGYALVLAAAVLLAFYLAHELLGLDGAHAVSVSFLVLALGQLVHVFNMAEARSKLLVNEITRNPWVWAAVAVCLALLAAGIYAPGLSKVLEVHPPSLEAWALIAGASLLPLVFGLPARAIARWRRRGN